MGENPKTIMKQTFEQFLEGHWFDHLSEGEPKDLAIEACEKWIEGLDGSELMELADKYGSLCFIEGQINN